MAKTPVHNQRTVSVALFFALILVVSCVAEKAHAPDQLILQKSGCLGSCPAYTIVLNRNGQVIYDGAAFTDMKGKYEGTVPKGILEYAFSVAEAFSARVLQPSYVTGFTDQETIRITVKSGDRARTVEFEDNLGPSILRVIEHAVEGTAAKVRKWKKIT